MTSPLQKTIWELEDAAERMADMAGQLSEMRRAAPYDRTNPHYAMPEAASEELERDLDEMSDTIDLAADYLRLALDDDDDEPTAPTKPKADDGPQPSP